jgi:aminopeptidase
MAVKNFENRLGKYADVIVQVGLNVQPGQKLMIIAQLETASLVREVAARAYRAGARLVDVLWDDEYLMLARLQNAPDGSFEEYPIKRAEWLNEHAKNGGALLSIRALNPDLLSNENPENIMTIQRTAMKYTQPYSELVSGHAINWCVTSAPAPGWAKKVFPDLSEENAIEAMWESIFELARINHPDPVAHWKEHSKKLEDMGEAMTRRKYTTLHYTAPGTDLRIGLVDGHEWLGGGTDSATGIHFVANIPTEEIFTMPHKDRIDGVVKATMPLNYQGSLVDDFSVTFEKGRVVDVQAVQGGDLFRNLISTDAGAASLGEVALVPYSSPISKSGKLFYNTLYDENASCHVALGRAYPNTMQDGMGMSQEKLASLGCNISLIHVDFMIGSNEMNIDGITADGRSEPIMRKGEWAFES